jgi:ATP synthase F1 gamma subunit
MPVLSVVKKDMEFYASFYSLTEVLKSIAVGHFRALEKRIETFAEFISAIESFFNLINIESISHPFIQTKEKPAGIVAVTSNVGLLGGLNMQVLNAALSELKSSDIFIVIGERGQDFARESKLSFVGFAGIEDESRYSQAMELRNYLITEAGKGRIGTIKIFYPRALSITVQRVEVLTALPVSEWPRPKNKIPFGEGIIMETSPSDMIEYMAYLWLGQKLYELFGFSRLAEMAARFIHLEQSSHEIERLQKELRLKFFRLRHEIIDRGMRELFAARALYG